MASTIVAQVVDTAESVQPGIAIPTENGSPTSDVVSKSAPVIETGAPAVEEPANKSEENDTAATDLATDSVPPNPESESANPSTAAPGLPNKHKTESEFNEVVGSSWKEYMNIRRQAGNLDNLNDVRHRDTIVDGMRVVGALLGYLTSLESRMSKISEGIDKDQKDAEKADDTTVDDENKPAPSLSYRFFHADNEFDANGELVESNDRLLAHSNNKEPNTLIRAVYSWTDGVSSNPPKLSIEESPRPEQINLVTLAIYSTPISKFFEKELGFDSVNHDIVRIGTPFRPLLRNLQAIRNHTEALQKTFNREESPPQDAADSNGDLKEPPSETIDNLPFATDSPEDSDAIKEEPYNQPEALGHFELLLEFVDQYLSKQVSLYRRLNSGHGEKIAFQDLWMLFDTGSNIYCPVQEGGIEILNSIEDEASHFTQRRHLPQVYRVAATTGGIPLTKSLASKYQDRSRRGFDYADANVLEFVQANDWPLLLAKTNPSRSTAEKNKNKYSPLYVMCFYLDFDGAKFDTVTEIFVFRPYDGDVDIRSLEAYPLQYYGSKDVSSSPDEDISEPKVEGSPAVNALVERGQKFIDCTAVTHMAYDSLTVGTAREEVNSEVMIDFRTAFEEYHDSFRTSKPVVPQYSSLTAFWPESYGGEFYEYYGSCADNAWCGASCISDFYNSNQKKKQQQMETKIKTLIEESEYEKVHDKDDYARLKEYMEKHDLIQLLPGVVPGYALRNRRWVQLDLAQLRPITVVDGWDRLVLPKGHGEMVQAMVETHAQVPRSVHNRESKVEMDLVRGKGKGCIILLHGAPGVGKTSTAECVASYTGRPLYPITCGDIGYLPDSVEKNMEEHFKLARRWGCVLLLDEADVFLAKRTKSDVKRNGLVSVFLRILEYYTGILFLTTNRVGAIDDAFRSRLHLTLYYPKLNGKQTRKIWKTNLKSIDANNDQRQKNNQPPIHYDSKKLLKWLDQNWEAMQWNGRQIRNAFQTAIALAEFKAVKSGSAPKKATLSTELFERIALASMEFSDYLLETHGGDEDHLASRDQVRPKNFEPKAKIKPLEDSDSSSESSSDSASAASSDESEAHDDHDGDSSADSDSESGSESDESSKKAKKDKSKKGKVSESAKDKKTRKEKEKKKAKKDRRDR